MKNNDKIYRRSGVSIACYVIAVLLLIYTFYTAGSIVAQINEYYAGYGMSATAEEYITYVLQNSLAYIVYTIVVFMLGYILDAVRKTDPSNFMTEEEYADAKAAKKEARDAKKIAKGEKKSAKAAEAVSDEEAFAEDFANDLDKELKADEKKRNYYKKSNNGNYRKQGNSGNRNNNRRGNGNGGRKNNDQNGQNNRNDHNNRGGQNESKVSEKDVTVDAEKTEAIFDVKINEDK